MPLRLLESLPEAWKTIAWTALTLIHCSIGEVAAIFRYNFQKYLTDTGCKIASGECHRTSLTWRQYWFRQLLGIVEQQAMTWANIDPDLNICHHLSHSKLTPPLVKWWCCEWLVFIAWFFSVYCQNHDGDGNAVILAGSWLIISNYHANWNHAHT